MSVARKTISSPCSVVMDLCTCIKCAITLRKGKFKVRLLHNQYSSTGSRLDTLKVYQRRRAFYRLERKHKPVQGFPATYN